MRLKLEFTSSNCSFNCNLFRLAFHVSSLIIQPRSQEMKTREFLPFSNFIFSPPSLHVETEVSEKRTLDTHFEKKILKILKGEENWKKTAFQLFRHDFPHEPNFMLKRLKWHRKNANSSLWWLQSIIMICIAPANAAAIKYCCDDDKDIVGRRRGRRRIR